MRPYRALPLFAKIALGAVLGVAVGEAMGVQAAVLKPIADIVLQLLRMLATPLIFLSILHSILSTQIRTGQVARLVWLLASNTLLAIAVGLGIGNLIRPGDHVSLPPVPSTALPAVDAWQEMLSQLPRSFIDPFSANSILGIILLAIALGLALRAVRSPATSARIEAIQSYAALGLQVTLKLLHWLFELIPLAVLAAAARLVGASGLGSIVSMMWFVAAVSFGLLLMFGIYAIRLRYESWVKPRDYFKGGFDAFALAFSTASSAATLPVTYECATSKIGLREETASLGIMIGGTFNHDGAGLYQTMAALFVARSLGHGLGLPQQALLIVMAFFASVAVAGIPEAGLVMMIAVFSSVHLPTEVIPLLLPLDWILDRLRTTVNVAGNLAATCMLDGKTSP